MSESRYAAMLLSLLPLTVARVEEMSDKLGFQPAWCMKPPKGRQPQPQLSVADGLAPVPDHTPPQSMPATQPVPIAAATPVMHMEITLL